MDRFGAEGAWVRMRLSAGMLANATAWAVIILLVCAAVLLLMLLGPLGLALLGGAMWLVCSQARMDQAMPTWGVHAFRAGMERPGRPEDRAASAAARDAETAPLRFYARLGMLLLAVGAALFAWQMWHL